MGIRIFLKCFTQIFQNWRVLLKLSWFWVAVIICLLYIQDEFLLQNPQEQNASYISSFLIMVVGIVVVVTIGAITIAVGWHRYVLLKETPPSINLLNGSWPNLAYFLMGFQIFLLLLICTVPIILVASPILNSAFSSGVSNNSLITLNVISGSINVFFVWLSLRLSITLPAIAIDKTITMTESLNMTSHVKLQMLIAAIALLVLQVIPSYIATSFFSQFDWEPVSDIVLNFTLYTINFICFIVGVGILTNAYPELKEFSKAAPEILK